MTDPVFKAPPVQAPSFVPPAQNQTPPAPVNQQAIPVQQATVPPTQTQPQEDLQQPVQSQGVATPQNNESTSALQQNLKEKLSKVNLDDLKDKVTHYLWYALGGCFILGMMFGCSMGGGDSKPVQQKVSRMEKFIVPNPDIKGSLPQCGRTSSRTNPCVFYILNADNHDHLAEDFFPDAVKKMNRNEFLLGQSNSMYAKTPIPPGYFAKIHVPKS